MRMGCDVWMLTTGELRREVERLRREVEEGAKERPVVTQRKVDYTNGDGYEGGVWDFGDRIIRYGVGCHRCGNGDVYTGDWVDDMRDGNGALEMECGPVVSYEGEWKKDKTHGYGTCLYRNGSRYEGDFSEDMRCGWGIIRFANGEHYEGEWDHDVIHGNGRWTVKDDRVYYEGQFIDGGISHGRHVDKDQKMEYEGSFLDGLPHGEGAMTIEKEWKYIGSFHKGQQSGKGTCQWETGHRYNGEWQLGLRHGHGRQSFRKELMYDGDWREDVKHGRGNWFLPSGDTYLGVFVNDEMQGKGMMIYSNGDKYSGHWSSNKRNGFGKCHYANGDKYKGEWCDDLRDGKGSCRFSDGSEFTGLWRKDAWIQSAASPQRTVLYGIALCTAVAGQTSSFKIEARDEDGQRRLSGGDTFLVVARDQKENQVFGDVKDHGNGLYTAAYQLNMSGAYEIYILSGDKSCVSDSPYALEVLPAVPCFKKTCIDIGELVSKPIPVEQMCEFYVSPRDLYGNCCRYEDINKRFPIEVILEGSNDTCDVSVSLGIDGHYHCSFIPTNCGYYRLFVTSNGRSLPKSPISIQVGTVADVVHSIPVDESQKWNRIIDEEEEDIAEAEETSEDRFIKEHPDVPVITNLEDLWKLNKLQRERKKKTDH